MPRNAATPDSTRPRTAPSLITKSQLPTSVMQLADPKYQGKLGIAPGETDFQPIVTSVMRTARPGVRVAGRLALRYGPAGAFAAACRY